MNESPLDRLAEAKEAEIIAAETHLAFEARVAQLIAANEALVLASIRMQDEADASAQALKALFLTIGKDNVEHEHHYAKFLGCWLVYVLSPVLTVW